MTVAHRLYLLISLSVLGLLALTATGIHEMHKVYMAADFVNVDTVPSLVDLDAASDGIARLRVTVWQRFSISDPEKGAAMEESFASIRKDIDTALNRYEKNDVTDDADRAFLQDDRKALEDTDALRVRALKVLNDGHAEQARQVLFDGQAAVASLVSSMHKHREYNVGLGRKNAETAKNTLQASNWIAASISALVIAVVAMMGLLLSRKIVRSLNRAVVVAQTVAAGDLTADIEVVSNDETGQLMAALRDMNGSLLRIVGQVRNGTDAIATASAQIASGNHDLAARTEHQASSLQQTASSMEELTGTVKQNANNAREANSLASNASTVATEGGAVVLQVIDTMGAINASARRIVDIIGVIDSIAFQTNILALNAAVEAARAGEQGRGFAVVATEVRNLAQRSAAAAREVKSLIDDAVAQVESGSKLVDSAGASMRKIVDSIRRVTDVVSEISAASLEQTSGIEQINQAIAHMDETTQQNSALVEEAAAAASALQDQAQSLSGLVGVFTIDVAQARGNRPRKSTTAVLGLSNATAR
jgi:methyl-accepting chemotaxis protein